MHSELKQQHADPATPPPTGVPHKVAITAAGFSAYYASFKALDSINLNIPANQVTALIGPSGCGKSTFLRWINRMNDIVPSARAEGRLTLQDTNVLDKNLDVVDLRKRVGMVFQKPNPFPKSIFDNVAFGPRLHQRLSRADTADIVHEALKAAALWDEVKDRLKSSALGLSGGQQQRLCIARAIAVNPQVLLMDEPCSALDPKSTNRIEQLIAELSERYTIVVVTHNMQQAGRISHTTAFFYEGALIEAGPFHRLRDNPTEERTRDYIAGRFG